MAIITARQKITIAEDVKESEPNELPKVTRYTQKSLSTGTQQVSELELLRKNIN